MPNVRETESTAPSQNNVFGIRPRRRIVTARFEPARWVRAESD